MRPDGVGSGGFDSHTLSPAVARLGRSVAVACTALALGAMAARDATAQQRDSLRAGVARADTVADSLLAPPFPAPPVSPRRAFLSSLALPGYGQARLQRPTASAVFFGIEAAGVLMLGKSLHDLGTAKRLRVDSIPATYALDEAGAIRRDANGLPVVATWTPGRYTNDLVRARRLQVEDWAALLLFNHLFAGAEAFVSAHLWDVPAAVDVAPTPGGGAALTARFRW